MLKELEKKFGANAENGSIVVKPESIVDVCKHLYAKGYTRLTAVTGVDNADRSGNFEVVYHVYSYDKNEQLEIKARIPAAVKSAPAGKETPEINPDVAELSKECVGCNICTKQCPQGIDVKSVIFGLKTKKDIDVKPIGACAKCGVCHDKCPKKVRILEIFGLLVPPAKDKKNADAAADIGELEIDSVTSVYKAADWHERETYDMLGIKFKGHPNLRRLFNPSTFEGHPLRKGYPLDKEQDFDEDKEMALDKNALEPYELASGETLMHMNIGPQHPSMHGVLRVRILASEEIVHAAYPVLGYLHRGIEKIAENMSYTQFVPYVDRLDYVSAMMNEAGYIGAVEKLMGINAPERAQYLRVIAMELNRIASHQTWLTAFGFDIGAITPAFYGLRDREEIVRIFEDMCGARMMFNYFCVGRVTGDMDESLVAKTADLVEVLPERIDEYEELLTGNEILKARTQGVGVLKKKDAMELGATGPVIRGSGVEYDVRKNHPYSIYDKFKFEIPTRKEGDAYARYQVRMAEMRQSTKILRQALDGIPQGEISAKVPRMITPPPGSVYNSVETPRGELGFYVISDGMKNPYRIRIRSPTFSNISVIPHLAPGLKFQDFLITCGSLDTVMGEVDK